MELGAGAKDRYKKITFWKEGLDEVLVKVFLESYEKAPCEIVLDVDTTDLPLHGNQEGRFFHGYYDNYCYYICHSTSSAANRCCARGCGKPIRMRPAAAWRRYKESWRRFGRRGRR